jgi:hypothetical protein
MNKIKIFLKKEFEVSYLEARGRGQNVDTGSRREK